MKYIFFYRFMLAAVFTTSFCNYTNAQVLAYMEPKHHNIFQNGYARILNVRIQPHDTTMVHIHAFPSVFISLSSAQTGSQVISEEQKPPPVNYNGIWFECFCKQPRIHRVWNSDTILMHVLDVELLSKNYSGAGKPLDIKNAAFLFEEKPARVYRINLNAAENFTINEHVSPLLLIALTEADASLQYDNSAAKKNFGKGDFFWIDANKNFSLENKNASPVSFVMIEFK